MSEKISREMNIYEESNGNSIFEDSNTLNEKNIAGAS